MKSHLKQQKAPDRIVFTDEAELYIPDYPNWDDTIEKERPEPRLTPREVEIYGAGYEEGFRMGEAQRNSDKKEAFELSDDYDPSYDEAYLKTLRERAKKNWVGKIDPDEWLKELREGYGD